MFKDIENLSEKKPVVKNPLIIKITSVVAIITGLIIILLMVLFINEYKTSMYEQLMKRSYINLSSIIAQIKEQVTLRGASNIPRKIEYNLLINQFKKALANDNAIVFFIFENYLDANKSIYPLTYSKKEEALKLYVKKKQDFECQFNTDINIILMSMPIYDNRDNHHGAIVMGVNPAFIIEGIKRTIQKVIIVGFIMISFGFGLSLVLAKIILIPIKRLEETAYSITSGDLTLRAQIKSTDEIATLGYAFNIMTESLKIKIDDLNAIQNLSKNISSHLSKEDLLNQIVQSFKDVTKATHCAILLQDDEYPEYFSTFSGIGVVTDAKCYVPKNDGLLCKVIKNEEITVVDTSTPYLEYALFFHLETEAVPNYKFLAIPFKRNNAVTAIIYATGAEVRVDKSSAELYEILADHANVAIENAKLYTLAITDGLTGVFLKRHYLFRLDQEIEKVCATGGQLSLIMIDIDFFKKVNDTFGHREGDIILKAMAEILKHCIRRKDIKRADREPDIIGRYGGEEFSILFLNAGKESIDMLADRVRASVESTAIEGEKQTHYITVSVGACVYEPGMNKDALIENADMALYESKHNGRNRYTVWQGQANAK